MTGISNLRDDLQKVASQPRAWNQLSEQVLPLQVSAQDGLEAASALKGRFEQITVTLKDLKYGVSQKDAKKVGTAISQLESDLATVHTLYVLLTEDISKLK